MRPTSKSLRLGCLLSLLLWAASPRFGRSAAPAPPGPAPPHRDPVLKQIDVPHPYYYREMYLPQVTSGPSGAAWSPDGSELVYSMQGTLWRQKIGTTEAEAVQLTDGPGYDFQPDWSPDGRRVLYTSYRHDALELWVLDLGSGASHALVANGAANLDARWSPDGGRVAYVSTAEHGRFHVFALPVADGTASGEPVRLTEERDGGLPRYYYSRFDQYLSPTWSPDGREILLVSNRGDVWGSGDLWRMEARPGAPMRLVRKEETNWKAAPDWARDGKRVVYSSYLGQQRNQLWLTTAEGGDPFELTYCACDHTRPRWAPDGRRIAFVSNEGGNTSLRVVAIPGGAMQEVTARRRRFLHPTGTLRLAATDPKGSPLPARLSVTGADGRGWAPDAAWRHADDAFDRAQRPFEITYFHADGAASLTLPAGEYTVVATHGLEYEAASRKVTVGAGKSSAATLRLARLADLPARGWWSGDLHVHMNYGGAYKNDPAHLRLQAQAEDLHVVEDLIVNKEQRIPDQDYFRGSLDPISTSTTLVKHDEEYHTSWWGHTGHLGLTDHLILPIYAGYFGTPAASLFPDNSTILDLSHAQGGVSGYVHPFDPPPPDPEGPDALTYALPVDVALEKADYLEVVGFSDHRITAEVWYRLLNCGFRIPTGAGTDAMANYASLRGPVGLNRVFVRSGRRLDYRAWLAALKAGRTFATNGPLLSLTLDGHEIGDELRLPAGDHRLRARVSLRSIAPVEHLEIVVNGVVAAQVSLPPNGTGTHVDAEIPVSVASSAWVTLRAWSAASDPHILDGYPFATTSPIYVVVDGRPIRHAGDAHFFVRWIERLESAAGAHGGWNDEREKAEVLGRLAAARKVFEEREAQALPSR